MPTLTQIANRIKKARRANIPDYKIGLEMGVCAAEVNRLASGKYPGPKVAKRLGLVAKCPSCHRAIPKPKTYRNLFDMPTKELLRRLRERS